MKNHNSPGKAWKQMSNMDVILETGKQVEAGDLAARMEPETTGVGSKDGTRARRKSVYTAILWGHRDCSLQAWL